MKELTFNFGNDKIRTCLINNEPYFCASDIGKVLELTNVYRQVKDIKGVHTMTTPTKGGNQEILFVPEHGLYELIFNSRKEQAKQFKQWVFEDVLPSIRKTGKYEIENKLKKLSTENRNILTDMWKEHGCTKPHEYSNLTKEEYKSLFNDAKKKKANMTREEILTLSALESMEALALFHGNQKGYYECRDSLKNTAKQIPTVSKKEITN